MWGRKADPRSELERLAAEIQDHFFSMPLADQHVVTDTLRGMFSAAGGLRVVPEALGSAIGRIILRVFTELTLSPFRKPSPAQLATQVALGAPRLLHVLDVTERQLATVLGEK